MNIVDGHQMLRFAAALIFVLALMGGLALVMRRINGGQPLVPTAKRRLKVLEVLQLDPRRRLILIQRDDREHLVILGADGETVIESGIESAQDKTHGSPSDG